jgi:hypothetical protein
MQLLKKFLNNSLAFKHINKFLLVRYKASQPLFALPTKLGFIAI